MTYNNSYVASYPPMVAPDSAIAKGSWAHKGIGGLASHIYQANRGHLVSMFRQPEQRLISEYYYYGPRYLYKDSLYERDFWPYGEHSRSSVETIPYNKVSLRDYAQWKGGCAVRQLTMEVLAPCDTLPLPTSSDVDQAINVLRDGFAFVGITEQWAMSVCLFRAMFGGECVVQDLANNRPGDNGSQSLYDTSGLYGWVDQWDGPLYAEAVSLFDSTCEMFGVDADTCASFCQV